MTNEEFYEKRIFRLAWKYINIFLNQKPIIKPQN